MTDPVVQGLEHVGGRVTRAIGRKGGKAVEDVLHDVGHGVEGVSKNVTEGEAKHVKDLEALAKARTDLHGEIGSTPVYRLNDDGTVDRLTPHGPVSLTEAEREHLPLNLDGENRVGQRPTGKNSPYNLPKIKKGESRPRKDSTQVPLGSTDLAAATQLSRHEDHSYGTYSEGGKSFQSNNYAAVRYGEKGDPNSFILVGRSDNPVHSERVLGIPFLQAGTAHGVTELYTEREPCTSRANCSAWMTQHLPGHITVTHSVEYGHSLESQQAGNSAMKNYLDGLRGMRKR